MDNMLAKNIKNQCGSALVIVMMVLLAVTSLSIMAVRTGTTELDVAANDKFHKMVFFAADGANEMTTQLVEQNIEERGFSTSTWGTVTVLTGGFFNNTEDTAVPGNNIPSETNRDLEVPGMGESTVYLKVYGNSALSTGSALQIAAGYEGIGKGVAGGGAQIVYEIRSLATGPSRSLSRIWLRWRHLL